MLAECLTFLTTPCPWRLRRLGYLGQVIGTQSRFRRCRSAWAPHLENCRRTILEAARSVADRRKATVLGSGLLLDVPLAELAATFKEVALVDVLHMRSARRAAARFPNVRLVEADVSGVIAGLPSHRHTAFAEAAVGAPLRGVGQSAVPSCHTYLPLAAPAEGD